MCYSGKCKYESYEGECMYHDYKNLPDDAYCVICELEILRAQMHESKNNFKYLVMEATCREEIMEKLKSNPETKDWVEEDFEIALFGEVSNMLIGDDPFWDINIDTK